MIRRFEFRKPVMQLDIAGHRFDVDMGTDIAEQMRAFGLKAQKTAETAQDDAVGTQEAWNLCAEAIDGVLGQGACDAIFAGRTRALYDIYDVIRFLTEAVNDFAIAGE